MPQICSTVKQETIDTINARAVKEGRMFSNMVAFILDEWSAKEGAKNSKQRVSVKKKPVAKSKKAA